MKMPIGELREVPAGQSWVDHFFHFDWAALRLDFHAVLADLDVAPHAVLHIGDRDDRDGVAARGAGCQVLILGQDFPSYDALRAQLAGEPGAT